MNYQAREFSYRQIKSAVTGAKALFQVQSGELDAAELATSDSSE